MAKAIPATQMHHIYEMITVYNMPRAKVEEATGVSRSVIDRIMRAYRTDDLAELRRLCEEKQGGLTMNYYESVCDYRGVDPNAWKEPEETVVPDPVPEQKASPNDDLWYAKVITCLGITMDANTETAAKLDELVGKIDKLTKAIESQNSLLVKTLNANTDVLFAELTRQTDRLGGIQENTKKLRKGVQI